MSRSPEQQRARDILCVRVTQQLFTLPVARNGALTCSQRSVSGRRCTGESGLDEKKRVDDSGGMKRVGGGGRTYQTEDGSDGSLNFKDSSSGDRNRTAS